MKRLSRCTLRHSAVALVLTLMFSARVDAANLRGQLLRGRYPAPGVTVTVFSTRIGRSVAVATDAYGMYYLNVPAGQYSLEVWVSNPPRVYPINVFEPGTDIPQIFL
jgi:hypothetical protein